MKKLIRTEKVFCLETIDENFIRIAASLGGKHSCPLTADFSRFTVEERFKGIKDNGCTVHGWSDNYLQEGFEKVNDGLEIFVSGFDTRTVIWQDGNIQGYYNGYYNGSNKEQYSAFPIKWIQLLIDYGFIEVVIPTTKKSKFNWVLCFVVFILTYSLLLILDE